MKRFKQVISALIDIVARVCSFPFLLIVLTPVEYGLWRAYKRDGYLVPNYIKFLWKRVYGTIEEINYTRIGTEPVTRIKDLVEFKGQEIVEVGGVMYIRKDVSIELSGKLNQKIWNDMQRIRGERDQAREQAKALSENKGFQFFTDRCNVYHKEIAELKHKLELLKTNEITY